ncbi:hypothetical protein DBR36_04070 [Microbacterium sp. HMWF026]|nr:hypothetical protein DBR36_04070 [Microbacterium sp. HMWF026]
MESGSSGTRNAVSVRNPDIRASSTAAHRDEVTSAVALSPRAASVTSVAGAVVRPFQPESQRRGSDTSSGNTASKSGKAGGW